MRYRLVQLTLLDLQHLDLHSLDNLGEQRRHWSQLRTFVGQLTVVAHCHVSDNLLEGHRLLALERLVAPVARVPELIAEVLDLPASWGVSSYQRQPNSLNSFASAMVGRVSGPLWAACDRRWWGVGAEDYGWRLSARCAM